MLAAATQAYFDRFNKADMQVRSCGPAPSDCQREYIAALRLPTAAEQLILSRLIEGARQKIRAAACHALLDTWNVRVLPSRFESGFPHTHGDMIVLSDAWIQGAASPAAAATAAATAAAVETLIHERIHVYQRYHPIETNMLIVHGWGLQPNRLLSSQSSVAWRANPDTNGILYKDTSGCDIMAAYRSNAPRSLSDTTSAAAGTCALQHVPKEHMQHGSDHPYELMAYMIADLIVNGSSHSQNPTQDDNNAWRAATQQWMREHLC